MADVDSYINNAVNVSNALIESAEAALTAANTAAQGRARVAWQDLGYNQLLEEPDYTLDLPTFDDYYAAPKNTVATPTFADAYELTPAEFPEAVEIAIDDLFLQEAPDTAVPPFTGTAPVIDIDGAFDGIEAPDIITYDPPELHAVEVGPVPEVIIPTFDYDALIELPGDPEDLAAIYLATYDNALPAMKGFIDGVVSGWITTYAPDLTASLSALQAKIDEGMPGGQALDTDFEDALYRRARTKVENERVRAENELTTASSKRGFSLPSGALTSGRSKLHAAASDRLATQATEISIERAKMEIQHVQFVMGLSGTIQSMLVNSSLQYAGTLAQINSQALQHAAQVGKFTGQVYDQLIARANLQIAVYKIEGDIYTVRLKSSLAQLEAYRAELEAAKLVSDLDETQVKLYTSLISSENIKIQQYVAEIDAASKKVGAEKLKIDIYDSEIKAYSTLMQSKQTELGVYTAALKGDQAKLQGRMTELDIYSKEIDAATSKQSMEIARAKLVQDSNRTLAALFEAELKGYTVEVGAESERFKGSVTSFSTSLEATTKENAILLATYKTKYDKARLDLEAARAQFDSNVKVSLENADGFRESIRIQASTAESTGATYGAMGASALASQNTMISQIESL